MSTSSTIAFNAPGFDLNIGKAKTTLSVTTNPRMLILAGVVFIAIGVVACRYQGT